MIDFVIGFHHDPFSEYGLTLVFQSRREMALNVKNIAFHSTSRIRQDTKVAFSRIYMREEITHRFDYPNPKESYCALTFDLCEVGKESENGWNVFINLPTREISIQESPYRVL